LLVPVLTAVHERVASGDASPNVSARAAVGEDVGDDERRAGIESLQGLGRDFVGREPHRPPLAAVRECAIGIGELQQADVGPSQRDRVAVEVGGLF
jgi:hypothetical protein